MKLHLTKSLSKPFFIKFCDFFKFHLRFYFRFFFSFFWWATGWLNEIPFVKGFLVWFCCCFLVLLIVSDFEGILIGSFFFNWVYFVSFKKVFYASYFLHWLCLSLALGFSFEGLEGLEFSLLIWFCILRLLGFKLCKKLKFLTLVQRISSATSFLSFKPRGHYFDDFFFNSFKLSLS